ncbi:hypothetical protein GQ42DRAFT_115309, partial [Ramicandelaber brevisporus]
FRVLIVEDNPVNHSLLVKFMKRKKIKYASAYSGEQAIDIWRKGTFHIILMDIQLPGISGFDATREIRRIEQMRESGGWIKNRVIIVALTASALKSDKEKAFEAGCDDFLTKPFDLVWLESKIVEWGCIQALIDYD